MTKRILTIDEVTKLQHYEFPGGYSAYESKQHFRFNAERALQYVNFGPKFFRHTKGAVGGQPLNPQPHQAAFYANLFGWEDPDTGLRRYRTAYREVGRGNGKSTECVVIAGGLLYLDDEPGAEIFSAAGMRDQAREVFNPFKLNVLGNPALNEVSQCYQNAVVRIEETTGLPCGTYKAVSADANTQHGGSPHGIIFDELHVQPNRELWDVLHTGKIKRRQPLTVAITTAGWDRHSICWEQRQYAEAVRDGNIEDPTFLPTIYAADIADDWTDPAIWKKANPNLGVSIVERDLAAECEKAKLSPAYENTFKRLHLDLWTEQAKRWLPMDAWDECGGKLPCLIGEPCWGGLDMSATQDLTAFVLAFRVGDDQVAVLPHFFMPADTARAKERSDRVPYRRWAQQGFVTLTPGNQVDDSFVMECIRQSSQQYNLQEVAFDRWGTKSINKFLEDQGIPRADHGQGFASMSGPSKDLFKLVLSRKLLHGGNPVLRWNASNVAIVSDAAENIKPVKDKSTGRIDGIVATIMALGRASSAGQSPYESRGLLFLGEQSTPQLATADKPATQWGGNWGNDDD